MQKGSFEDSHINMYDTEKIMNYKSIVGIYCDKMIYSVLLHSGEKIETKKAGQHQGRLRHFKFINYLKSLGNLDLCVIVQNDESKPIINYLRREKKRPFLVIDFSPIPNQSNYRENPDLMTLARKLAYKRRISDVVFSSEYSDLKNQIDNMGEGDQAIHMRSLDGNVLAWMASIHGIFILED